MLCMGILKFPLPLLSLASILDLLVSSPDPVTDVDSLGNIDHQR
jgi:hypothetical protein